MSKQKNENPISAPQLEEQIELQSVTGDTIIVFGPSGVGKTTIMSNTARKHFDDVWLTNLSHAGPTDATGLGLPEWGQSPSGEKILEMLFSQPKTIPTVERVGDKRVYWILDEMGNWDPDVRASFHGVTSPPDGGHRYLGSHVIGPNVVVGITSNRRCDGATVGRFSIPEVRRGVIVTFIPDPGDWWRWADSNPAYAGTHVPSFIAYGNSVGAKEEHKNHFLGDPKDFDPLIPNAQPNPRSWERVMETLVALNKGECKKSAARVSIQGRVGLAATNALRAYLSVMESEYAFKEIKANPNGFTVPKGVDKQFMLASGVMLYASGGIADVPAALHSGEFDWVFDAMQRFKPEVTAYGLTTAERRGIDVPSRKPELWAEVVGA